MSGAVCGRHQAALIDADHRSDRHIGCGCTMRSMAARSSRCPGASTIAWASDSTSGQPLLTSAAVHFATSASGGMPGRANNVAAFSASIAPPICSIVSAWPPRYRCEAAGPAKRDHDPRHRVRCSVI